MKKKCDDCNNEQTVSQKFVNELTLGRLIAIIAFVITTTFSIGAGTTQLYHTLTETKTQSDNNKTTVDSILVVTTKLYNSNKKIADYLSNNHIIPDYLTFKDIEKDSIFVIADNTIYPKPTEEKKRIANSETACDTKDFETKILK